MSATTTVEITPSLRAVVAEVHEPDSSTRELAEAAAMSASESENHEALIRGWQDEVRSYERALREPTRSGHQNNSGRYEQSASLPDRGILATPVRTDDGVSHLLGDLDREVLGQVVGDYDRRIERNTARKRFYVRLERELRKSKKGHVRDLGAERVEAIQAQERANV